MIERDSKPCPTCLIDYGFIVGEDRGQCDLCLEMERRRQLRLQATYNKHKKKPSGRPPKTEVAIQLATMKAAIGRSADERAARRSAERAKRKEENKR